MLHIGFKEAVLLFGCWVSVGVKDIGFWRVIIITPFSEVICEFEAWDVSGRVLEVNYYQLLVFVCREQQRRLSAWLQTKQVPVLCLDTQSARPVT